MTNRPQLKRTLGIAILGTLAWMVACSDDSDDDGGGGLGNSGTAGAGTGGTNTGKGGSSGTGGTSSGTGGTGNVAGTGGTSAGTAGTSAGAGGTVAGAAGTAGGAGNAGSAGTAGDAGGAGTAGAAGTAGSAGSAGSAGAAGTAGTAGGGGSGGAIGATANYNFEVDIQGWSVDQEPATVVLTQTTTQHFGDTGTGSLQIAITPPDEGGGGAGGEGGTGIDPSAGGEGGASEPADLSYLVRITDPPLSPGQTVTLHIFVPETGVSWAQLVIQSKADWSGWDATPITLTPGMWTTFQHTVPLTTVPPIRALIVQLGVAPTFSGNVFLDEISW